MKKSMQWSFLIVGAVIGAGYASGREIWLFFGPNSGRAILLFSLVFAVSSYGILSISYRHRTNHYKPVLQSIVGKTASYFYDWMMIIYLIFTTIIMIAGSGVTFEVYQVPKWFGILFIVFMLIWAFSYSLDQVININTIIIPVLLSILFIILFIFINKQPDLEQTSVLSPNYLKAVSFTSVNVLPIISVLGAVGHKISSKTEIILTSIISATILGVLSWVYNHSLTLIETEIDLYEMPIYGILVHFPNLVLIVITVILWIAIYTTAIGSMLGLISRIQTVIHLSQLKIAVLLVLLITPLSFVGFQFLVELIYPLYGLLNLYILFRLMIYPLQNMFKEKMIK
ncbi:YkvI family membrane protein [Amphibacillus sp. Q70]|uniref:YkvI family membrane protein n=1 Tax=Amphibacillus sp. Q70 TaxID=3453416 RepID=UPI003F8629BC